MAARLAPFVNKFQGKTQLSSAEFVNIFRKFDVDGNGYIEKGELNSFLTELLKEKGAKIKDDKDFQSFKNSILTIYDENSDNKISMDELAKILPTEENFLLHFRDSNKLHIADFIKIWYHYDTNKSGYLESDELKGFLHDLLKRKNDSDAEVTPQLIDDYYESILDLFDKNKDGKIEISEMSKILPVEENFLKKFQCESELTKGEFEQLFKHYDQDDNGYIEDTELMGFLRDLLQNKDREPTTIDLEQYRTCIMEISDSDKDGRLSKAELQLLLLSKTN